MLATIVVVPSANTTFVKFSQYAKGIMASVMLLGIVTSVRLEQIANASCPIVLTPSDNVKSVNPIQYTNAFSPIDSTLDGIVILVSPMHIPNAASPIDITVSGIMMSFNPTQPQNAPAPIDVTPSTNLTEASVVFGSSIFPSPPTAVLPHHAAVAPDVFRSALVVTVIGTSPSSDALYLPLSSFDTFRSAI